MKIRLLLCVLLAGVLSMADELLSDTVKTYSWMSKASYTVNLDSPELAGLVGLAIQMKTQQMGMPIAVKIRNFELKSDITGGFSAKVGLDMDEAMRVQMEPQINQMLGTLGFSKTMGECSLGAIRKLADYLEKNADSFTETPQSNDKIAQYVCDTPSMMLMGSQSVSKIIINVNRQYKIIMGIRFDLSDGAAILVQFSHGTVGDKACPTKMVLKHNIRQKQGGMVLPPQINATFTNYRFQ